MRSPTLRLDGVVRALEQEGEDVTVRRMTGTQRIPFDVVCRAFVQTGGATLLIGGVQITADRVTITSVELDEARFPGAPRHGDEVIFSDGRVSVVQGRADVTAMADGSVMKFDILGSD